MSVSTRPDPYLFIETTHSVEIQWWWTDATLHDMDYQFSFSDKIDAKVKQICATHEVEDDTEYCCQWDGRRLISSDLVRIGKAGKELATYLKKFTGIQFIGPAGTEAN